MATTLLSIPFGMLLTTKISCYAFNFIFQSLLGCFTKAELTQVGYSVVTFNPFWDASKVSGRADLLCPHDFQSLLGCFEVMPVTSLVISLPFNPFWDASENCVWTRGAGTESLSIPFGMLLNCAE